MRESSGVARERICVARRPRVLRQACFVTPRTVIADVRPSQNTRALLVHTESRTQRVVKHGAHGRTRTFDGRTASRMCRPQRVTDLKLDEPTVVVACATCSVSRGSAVPSAVLTHLRQAWEYMDGHRKT